MIFQSIEHIIIVIVLHREGQRTRALKLPHLPSKLASAAAAIHLGLNKAFAAAAHYYS